MMGDRISFSIKRRSFQAKACRIEYPGRNRTNKTRAMSERADRPPIKNAIMARKKPTIMRIFLGRVISLKNR